ncbi:hypothetical protein [Streptomyces sp. S.PB5]|uniref:hypothetical protein n=1 Tax=Streptomyces sp. S.PB5 TaxID=3020844 RepID=UPI0025B1D7CB|nr:hypothetical protein [Streptomyces sp. S.PB5]MDN3023090.1 hypothetical protein [Streptomyces sp. S.PB5]
MAEHEHLIEVRIPEYVRLGVHSEVLKASVKALEAQLAEFREQRTLARPAPRCRQTSPASTTGNAQHVGPVDPIRVRQLSWWQKGAWPEVMKVLEADTIGTDAYRRPSLPPLVVTVQLGAARLATSAGCLPQ